MMAGVLLNKQHVLDMVVESSFDYGNFIVSDANIKSFEYLCKWPDWHKNCCILLGEKSSGKSHLASIWAKKARAEKIKKADINNAFLAKMSPKNLILEDIDSNDCAKTLFHIINKSHQSGTFLLLTSSDFNIVNNFSLPDLTSRLRQAFLLRIEKADDNLLAQIFCKLLSDRQVEVDIQCVYCLLRNTERSYSNILKAVIYLDKKSLEQKRPITTRFVSEQIEYLVDKKLDCFTSDI